MATYDLISKYLSPLMPYVQMIILFIIPIYLTIGNTFASIGLPVVAALPVDISWLAYVICGVIAIVGLIIGIKTDPERNQ